jgi:hypothetical protein
VSDDEFNYYDRESVIGEEPDAEEPLPDAVEYDPDAVVGNLQWDEDLTPGPSTTATDVSPAARRQFLAHARQPVRHPTQDTVTPRSILPADPGSVPREDTPLLQKNTTLTFAEPPAPARLAAPADGNDVLPSIAMPIEGPPVALSRRGSQVSMRSRRGSNASKATKGVQTGQSTFGQTVGALGCWRRMLSLIHDTAVQRHRYPPRDWHAIRAFGIRLCGLDRRGGFDDFLWVYHMLYVCQSLRFELLILTFSQSKDPRACHP